MEENVEIFWDFNTIHFSGNKITAFIMCTQQETFIPHESALKWCDGQTCKLLYVDYFN